MGCGGSLPKEEELKAQSPPDSPCGVEEFPATGEVAKYCIISGEDVRVPKPEKASEEKVLIKMYCIGRSGKRVQNDEGLVTLTTFPAKKLIGAWETKGGNTTIYTTTSIVAGSAAVELPIMEEIEKAPLYPFAQVSGGRAEGKQSKPFTISKHKGNNEYEKLYDATSLGGNFWKIEKGVGGDLACLVVPASMHFNFIANGATACVSAAGVDPMMMLFPMCVKNCNILGPTFKMPGQ